MIQAGRFNPEIAGFLNEMTKEKTKRMIAEMGKKYCLHPANAPKKGNYGC